MHINERYSTKKRHPNKDEWQKSINFAYCNKKREMDIDLQNIEKEMARPILHLVGEVADSLHRECYVVGGFVRDIILKKPSDDLDFVTVGSGIEVAKAVAEKIGRRKASLAVFKTYGTAQVKTKGMELEFVGARRESYQRNSRNPIVEDGTLHDDQCRRDFTINAMAISVNALDPDITFSDDPLRMMRAVRFATRLGFDIYPETMNAIARNAERIKIITRERIAEELMKIMRTDNPSRGFMLLSECGLLPYIFPELAAMQGVDTMNGRAHKDNFMHTMQVLDNVASQSQNEWLRWGALLHDIGKAVDHEAEGTHVTLGAELARKYHESPDVIHAILAHHNDVEPQTVEAVLVQAADAISAARPGARRESLENYIKRLEKLEEIANSFQGVEKCFAIQSGREVRIMVKPEDITDEGTKVLAKEVAKRIEKEMEYPGQIRVNVIRETRSTEFAK